MTSAARQTFGAPTALLTSTGENNYYPAFSPDGSFVVFNRVPLMGAPTPAPPSSCPNDAFSNPRRARAADARRRAARPSTSPTLNGSGAAHQLVAALRARPCRATRATPIAWVTFSSTRDYGDVVRNSAMVGRHDATHLLSARVAGEHVDRTRTSPRTRSARSRSCGWRPSISPRRPAAAIRASPRSGCRSRIRQAHNHIAQWVVQIVGPPPTGDVRRLHPGWCQPARAAASAATASAAATEPAAASRDGAGLAISISSAEEDPNMISGSAAQALEMINSPSKELSYAQGSQFDSERSHRYWRSAMTSSKAISLPIA